MNLTQTVKRKIGAFESWLLPHDPYYEAAPWQLRALLWVSLLYAFSVAGVETARILGAA